MIFFAAGNSGAEGSDGSSTITMEASGKNMVAVGSSETTLDTPDINYVAWYSSKGPVYDYRIKPDLVAPGDQLLSANSNGNDGQSCSTTEKTGTSMASPSAAGSALLVRQYFMDTSGRFWSGRCKQSYRSCHDFAPSGPLVKAVLIHSNSPMSMYNGGGDRDVQLGAAPDYMQGFGRVTLSNALPLQGTNLFDLFVDGDSSLGEYSQASYAVRIDDGVLDMPLKYVAPRASLYCVTCLLVFVLVQGDSGVVRPRERGRHHGPGAAAQHRRAGGVALGPGVPPQRAAGLPRLGEHRRAHPRRQPAVGRVEGNVAIS